MSGFNFTLNSTPQSNNVKINTATTSTPFSFGSSGSLNSTPATNLFGSLKTNTNSSASLGSSQTNPISSSNNLNSLSTNVKAGGLNFSSQKESAVSTTSVPESKPSTINGQSLFSNSSSSLTAALSSKTTLTTTSSTSTPTSLSSITTIPKSSQETGLDSLDKKPNQSSSSGIGFVLNSSSNNEINKPKTETSNQIIKDSTSKNNMSNTLASTNSFNLGTNQKSDISFAATLTTESKQKRGIELEKNNASQPISNSGSLPNVLSFNVPSLNSPAQDSKSENKTSIGLGGTSNLKNFSSVTTSNQPNKSLSTQFKQTSIKDHHLPNVLMDCIDEFKKKLEEMRRTKELNSTFTSKMIHQNIQEILTLKQCITQSQTEFQRNFNEVAKLKENILQELRNVDICDHLKDMPLGLQYDCDIWNEYFMSRVKLFQNKLRILKNQFEQLEGYFRVHDRENIIDTQRIVETLKASHKNLLNEAAMLKIVHEKVDELKNNFLIYRKNMVGDTTNIFENSQNNNLTINLNNSIFKI